MNTVLKRLAWVTHLYEVGSPIRDQVEALAARHEVIRIHLVEAHEAEQNLLATIGKLWTEAEITQAKADALGLAVRAETVRDDKPELFRLLSGWAEEEEQVRSEGADCPAGDICHGDEVAFNGDAERNA